VNTHTVGTGSFRHVATESIAIQKNVFRRISDAVAGIFRALNMLIRYCISSANLKFIQWLQAPLSIPFDCISVPAQNIAEISKLSFCLASARNPISKIYYQQIGREENLRVAYDLVWKPTGGLCLGMSLAFLAEYLKSSNLIEAAKKLQNGANESAIRTQAIYDAVLGIDCETNSKEIRELSSIRLFSLQPALKTKFPHLEASLRGYLKQKDEQVSLREFVLKDLEANKIELTPDLYGTLLEVDARLNARNNVNYQALYKQSTQVAAKTHDLDLGQHNSFSGNIKKAEEFLMTKPEGSYLIQLPTHTIAFVKTRWQTAIFDPNAGLVLLTSENQERVFNQLFNYYFKSETIQFQTLQVH
jgi:hypothetical protein